jgi:hypothetical protein
MFFQSFFKSNEPKQIETALVEYVASRLSGERGALLLKQFSLTEKFQRLNQSMEVDLFYKKDVPFPEECKFHDVPIGEYLLAKLSIQDNASGHGTICSMHIVGGHLFSFEFSLPPGDIDAANMSIVGNVFDW